MTPSEIASELAKLSRKTPTEAQRAASKRNGILGAAHGKKGGRPRKQPLAAPQQTPTNPPKTNDHTHEPPETSETKPMALKPKESRLLPTLGSQVQSLRRF